MLHKSKKWPSTPRTLPKGSFGAKLHTDQISMAQTATIPALSSRPRLPTPTISQRPDPATLRPSSFSLLTTSARHFMATNPFYFPAHEVQRPTVDRLHVRSAEDAHTLFEAVRTGYVAIIICTVACLIESIDRSLLRPVIRRLNDAERSAFIRSGSVFVWEESEEAIGLRRVSVS